MNRLRVLSLNVRGLGSQRKVDLVMPVMRQWNVVFLQETFVNSQRKMERCMRLWGGEGYCGFGSEKSAGVGILVSEGAGLKVCDVKRDTEGRALSCLAK